MISAQWSQIVTPYERSSLAVDLRDGNDHTSPSACATIKATPSATASAYSLPHSQL